MELEFRQVQLPYLQCVLHETIFQEENGESVVPDGMPDMERIVDSFAGAVLRDKEWQGGTVSLSGDIQGVVLYQARQEEQPRALSVYLPFSLRRTVAGEDCRCIAACSVRSVDARMLHSRKLSIRVGLCITLEVWEPQEELCCAPGDTIPRCVQLKCTEYPMELPAECGQKSLLLRETLSPEGGESPARILHTAGRCEITDEKLAGSRAVCKGNLHLDVLYENAEGAPGFFSRSVPFSQVAELSGEYGEQGLRLCPAVTNLEAAVEGGEIDVEAGIELQYCVSRLVPVPMVEDAYATKGRLELQWREFGMRPRLDGRVLRQECHALVKAQASRVIRAEALPDAPEISWQNGVCKLRVPVRLRVLYRDAEGRYGSASEQTELCAELPAGSRRCRATARVEGTVFAAPGAGGIEVRVPIALTCDWYADAELRSVCGGTLEDEPAPANVPAVIIRTPEREVELWELAKELRTTVSAIQLANDMQEEVAPAGAMLLIPIVA